MDTRKAKRYTKDQCDELVELFRQSGMKAGRFCKENGVSYPTLRKWLEPAPSERAQLIELVDAGAGAPVTARLPNGISLEIPAEPGAAAAWIRELMRC